MDATRIRDNLPLVLGLAITVVFSCEAPVFRSLKTERTFGWWLVLGLPVAVLLFLGQLGLWVARPSSRPWIRCPRKPTGRTR
jgi:hypothetical protein